VRATTSAAATTSPTSCAPTPPTPHRPRVRRLSHLFLRSFTTSFHVWHCAL
jgi:hypothetical protein